MRLMILEKQRLRNSLKLEAGLITIGSDSNCHIHLPDPRVGKHQANISKDDTGDWWLEVVDHMLPTCLNRAVQKTKAKLRHADEIECGEFSIKLYIESERSREELQHDRVMSVLKSHGDMIPLGAIILKEDVELKIPREHLMAMTRLALEIGRRESIHETLPILLGGITELFQARRSWLGLRKVEKDEFDWMLGQTQTGRPIDRPPFSRATEPRCLKFGHHICTPETPQEQVGAAMAVPVIGGKFTLGMLYVENDPGDPAYDEDALISFKALANAVSIPLDAIIHHDIAARRAAVTAELTMVRATQDALTPKALPQWDEMQVAAYRRIGEKNCSDLYDVMQLRDKTAALLVARVHWPLHTLAGVMGELRGAFRSAVLYGEAPHLFARALNWLLHTGDQEAYADMAVARVWPQTGKVQLCLAGKNIIAARVGADGTAHRIDSGDSPPAGLVRGTAYSVQEHELSEGDSLVLATAGVDYALNEKGEPFGSDALCETVCDGLGDTPGHVLNEFASDLGEFLDGGSIPDDVSVLLIRRE